MVMEDSSMDSGSYPSARPPIMNESPVKKTKLAGAATYHTNFNPEWQKEFTFITSVKEDPHRFVSNINVNSF